MIVLFTAFRYLYSFLFLDYRFHFYCNAMLFLYLAHVPHINFFINIINRFVSQRARDNTHATTRTRQLIRGKREL